MTVQELRQRLLDFDQDLQVIFQCYSDYQPLEATELVVEEVMMHHGRPTRYYARQYETKPETRLCLVFPGN